MTTTLTILKEYEMKGEESSTSYANNVNGLSAAGRVDVQTWQRFTVSGRPCRYGTQCIENREAGFWYCDLEGGDAGAWDYCCRPGHQCGYSEGYNYPW
jgi:hypothetical protein